MLCLTRTIDQVIKIGENTYVTVLNVKGKSVRLGISAPENVPIVRLELTQSPAPAPETTARAGLIHRTA